MPRAGRNGRRGEGKGGKGLPSYFRRLKGRDSRLMPNCTFSSREGEKALNGC